MPYKTTAYRYPTEQVILGTTMLLVLGVIAITATATFCLSGVFIALFVWLAYASTRTHHRALMKQAYAVTPATTPELAALVDVCAARLQVEPVEVYVARRKAMNAYTFGITSPKVIVLHAPLFEIMDAEELQFIIGHEMGHVRLGHTWLNTLIGGMAGIPSPYAAFAILNLAFRSWNRACEFSADRAGMLACGNPHKAVSALVKIYAGPQARTQQDFVRAAQQIEAEDDTLLNNLGELLGTHPLTVKRIEEILDYAKSAQFRKINAGMDRNAK